MISLYNSTSFLKGEKGIVHNVRKDEHNNVGRKKDVERERER